MPKDKPAVEQDENSLARPPWLPPEKERRWPLPTRGKQKKKPQVDPAPERRKRGAPAATDGEPHASDELEDFTETSEDYPQLVDRSDLEEVDETEFPAVSAPVPADETEHRPRHAREDDGTDFSVATHVPPPAPVPSQPQPQPQPQNESPTAEDRPTPRDWQPSPPPELAAWLEPVSTELPTLDSADSVVPEEAANDGVQEQPPHTEWLPIDASPEPLPPPEVPEQVAELESPEPPAPNTETPDSEIPATPEIDDIDHHPGPLPEAPQVDPAPSEAFDEVEQRAAALLAAMEAKRSQRAVDEPDSDGLTDHAQPAEVTPDEEQVLEEPSEPIEAPSEPVEEPVQHDVENPLALATPDEVVTEDVVSDVDPDALPEPFDAPEARSDTAPEAIVVEPDEPEPQHPPNRKLALPPWQLPGSAASAEFERFGPEKSDPDEEPSFSARHNRPEDVPMAPPHDAPAPAPEPPPAPRYPGPPPLPPAWPPPPPPPGWLPPPPPPPRGGFQGGHSRRRDTPPPASHPAAPPANYRAPQPFRVPPPLDEAELINRDLNAPQTGWRRAVHKTTGGHVNLGPSRRERLREEIQAQIRQPIVGDFRIAVLSIKGGVGKTTTTLGLGSALAMVRHDRVIAVDANPDRGTLAERVRDLSTRSTVRDLLSDPNIHGYADIRNHTLMAPSRLEVLASEQEPAVSEVFGDADYRRTIEILRHYYNIILTDCGTGIMHSAMSGVLDLAHTIVLVSAPAMDAARSASATLDWLMQHGHSRLVRGAHVVFSASRPGSANLKLDKLYEHFETRCQSVHMIPFDPHLSEGADVDIALLRPETMDAYLDLAAAVSEDFGRLRGVTRP